jgi:hypothetical protein
MTVIVTPNYGSISAVRDIAMAWITIWSGDEWGESMHSLHSACHTDYGFSDEDCALFASRLIENLIEQKEWIAVEGRSYGCSDPESEAEAATECRRLRDYWREGGNITGWEPVMAPARQTIDSMPAWLFGEEDW